MSRVSLSLSLSLSHTHTHTHTHTCLLLLLLNFLHSSASSPSFLRSFPAISHVDTHVDAGDCEPLSRGSHHKASRPQFYYRSHFVASINIKKGYHLPLCVCVCVCVRLNGYMYIYAYMCLGRFVWVWQKKKKI